MASYGGHEEVNVDRFSVKPERIELIRDIPSDVLPVDGVPDDEAVPVVWRKHAVRALGIARVAAQITSLPDATEELAEVVAAEIVDEKRDRDILKEIQNLVSASHYSKFKTAEEEFTLGVKRLARGQDPSTNATRARELAQEFAITSEDLSEMADNPELARREAAQSRVLAAEASLLLGDLDEAEHHAKRALDLAWSNEVRVLEEYEETQTSSPRSQKKAQRRARDVINANDYVLGVANPLLKQLGHDGESLSYRTKGLGIRFGWARYSKAQLGKAGLRTWAVSKKSAVWTVDQARRLGKKRN